MSADDLKGKTIAVVGTSAPSLASKLLESLEQVSAEDAEVIVIDSLGAFEDDLKNLDILAEPVQDKNRGPVKRRGKGKKQRW